MSIKLQYCDTKIMIVSSLKCKSIVVYDLYGVCTRTFHSYVICRDFIHM